jgi:hypothetical protein
VRRVLVFFSVTLVGFVVRHPLTGILDEALSPGNGLEREHSAPVYG